MSAARAAGACLTLSGEPRRFLPRTAHPTRSKEGHQPRSRDGLPARVSKAINRGSQRRRSGLWLASVNTIVQNAEPLRQDSGGASRKNTTVGRCCDRRTPTNFMATLKPWRLIVVVAYGDRHPLDSSAKTGIQRGPITGGAPSKETLTCSLFMPFQRMTVVPSTPGERS